MTNLTLLMPDDMHVHLRQDEMLRKVVGYTASQCNRALVMPNTNPPIATSSDIIRYRNQITSVTSYLHPLMTFKVMPSTTREIVVGCHEAGAIAGKLYPQGVTTNSEDGVQNFEALYPAFEVMEKLNITLCIHGENPDEFIMRREISFLDRLLSIVRDFPKLKIVLEHITTMPAVEVILSLPDNVAATITVHHLWITLDDVLSGGIKPHNFCYPIAKAPEDRQALIEVATSGNPKFFLGTDSAPHHVDTKETNCGCAGVFSAPVMLPLLAEIFEQHDALDKLEGFTSVHGAAFYGLPPNEGTITLEKEAWTIPERYSEILVPFRAGKECAWKITT